MILFIVNGEDVLVEVDPSEPLSAARDQALKKSRNTGRPPEEWTTRNERGEPLDPTVKIETFGFPLKVRLFLSLQVGFGGSADYSASTNFSR
jgi:hypothetical protein